MRSHVNVYQILKFKCVCACVDVKIRLKVPSKYFLNLIFISSCHAFASWLHECLHTCKVRVRDKKEFLVWMYEYRCHWCKIISFPWRISSRFTFYVNSHVEKICCCSTTHSNYAGRIQKFSICYWCWYVFHNLCVL